MTPRRPAPYQYTQPLPDPEPLRCITIVYDPDENTHHRIAEGTLEECRAAADGYTPATVYAEVQPGTIHVPLPTFPTQEPQ
jgi:hypothetical protein